MNKCLVVGHDNANHLADIRFIKVFTADLAMIQLPIGDRQRFDPFGHQIGFFGCRKQTYLFVSFIHFLP